MKLIVLLLLATGIGFLMGRNRSGSPQNRGEAAVKNALQSNFNSPDYHLLNNVTLRLEDGTTQIDHILVSRFGVFVIETKDYRGWTSCRREPFSQSSCSPGTQSSRHRCLQAYSR